MKKMQEIVTASASSEPLEPEKYEKDRLITELEAAGHIPIAVDRSLMVVEQCEPTDDFPKGLSSNPLKVSIYSDPEVSGARNPSELFIHGGRYGVMELFLRPETHHSLFRMLPVEASDAEHFASFGSNVANVKVLLNLAGTHLTGFYTEVRDQGLGFKTDARLEALGKEAQLAIQKYLEHLLGLPNVWSGYPENPAHGDEGHKQDD